MTALRVAVFPLSAKKRRGGHFLPPPPPPVRVLNSTRGYEVWKHRLHLTWMPIAGYRPGFYQTGCNEFKVSGREPLFNYSVNAIIFILLSACARNTMLISIRVSLTLFLEKQSDKKTSRVSYFV